MAIPHSRPWKVKADRRHCVPEQFSIVSINFGVCLVSFDRALHSYLFLKIQIFFFIYLFLRQLRIVIFLVHSQKGD
jgi:hypothetical protein